MQQLTAIFCNAFCFFCTIFRTQSLVPFLQMSGDPGLIQQQPTTQQSDPNFVTNTQDPVQNQMNGSAMGPCNDQFGSAINNQMVSFYTCLASLPPILLFLTYTYLLLLIYSLYDHINIIS